MTSRVEDARATWQSVCAAPVLDVDLAGGALAAMEFSHTRYLDEQREIAERIASEMAEAGRLDLARRAELVLASIAIRSGATPRGARAAKDILARAELHGDVFAIARAHYLLAWVGYFIGDISGAQIHATRCVELLEDLPAGAVDAALKMDHTMVLAITSDLIDGERRYYGEALALAAECNDPVRTITLYNNIAYSAVEAGDIATALEYVERMVAESSRTGTPLVAVHAETVARAYILDGQFQRAVDLLSPIRDADADGSAVAEGAFFTEPHALAAALLALAQAFRGLGQLDDAHGLLSRVRELADARGLAMFVPELLREEAELAAAAGDFATAYETYTAFHEARLAQQSEEANARARAIQASIDADRSRREAERFRELAMRDALTGLYNRRYWETLVTDAVAAARAEGTPLSLAIIDADYFKRINDELSHDVGDQVLRVLANLLVSARPAHATVCRLGGEEFVVLLPRTGVAEAQQAAEALRRAVAENPWAELTGTIPVTVTVGVTTAPDGRTSPAALMSDADRNLYAAKRSGRNRVLGDAVEHAMPHSSPGDT